MPAFKVSTRIPHYSKKSEKKMTEAVASHCLILAAALMTDELLKRLKCRVQCFVMLTLA